jgi:hypothetical protein
MSLIFDGLRRRVSDKKRSLAVSILEEAAGKVLNLPNESSSIRGAFLSESYRETLTKPDCFCITVDYSSQKGQSQSTDDSMTSPSTRDISRGTDWTPMASFQSGVVVERYKETLMERNSSCISVD